MSDEPINDLALLTAARALADVHIEDLKEPDKMLQAAHMFAKRVISQHEEIERLRRMVSKLEIDRGFYENEIDAKRLVLASDVAADRDRLRAALAEALKEWQARLPQFNDWAPSMQSEFAIERIAEMRREWKL